MVSALDIERSKVKGSQVPVTEILFIFLKLKSIIMHKKKLLKFEQLGKMIFF